MAYEYWSNTDRILAKHESNRISDRYPLGSMLLLLAHAATPPPRAPVSAARAAAGPGPTPPPAGVATVAGAGLSAGSCARAERSK